MDFVGVVVRMRPQKVIGCFLMLERGTPELAPLVPMLKLAQLESHGSGARTGYLLAEPPPTGCEFRPVETGPGHEHACDG